MVLILFCKETFFVLNFNSKQAKELKNARGSEEYCGKCKQIVYEAEKREIEINGKKEIYHKGCFRCADCNVQLELNSFGSVNRSNFFKKILKHQFNYSFLKSSLLQIPFKNSQS